MEKLWQIVRKINIDPSRALFDEPMRDHTTFKIGGPADVLLELASVEELSRALNVLARENIPRFIVGGGANLLVGDRGIRGFALDMSKLSGMDRTDFGMFAGAGSRVDLVCENALALGLGGGLADFYGMPGTVGGAVYMNARCYGRDFSELVESCLVLSPSGEISEYAPGPGVWDYKKSPFMPGGEKDGFTIATIRLKTRPENPLRVAALMRERRTDRVRKGHYRHPSAGSMFKNDRRFGEPTGRILDRLGMKGYRIGDAAVSEYHANIFVNLGAATAKDMKALVEEAQHRVAGEYGIKPEPEVLFVGEF